MPHVHYYHMPNFQNSSLVQTYISHANHVLNMNEGKGNHTTSTRASIEADIIRLIHEGQFPLEYKIACTSMVRTLTLN
ncbi:hypothetical protein VTN31DRAFT_6710 [Thermomyces dupontii]|uniref:uncharacterized protein n=1 Tax=Talaromyces thermophilus TaxID=28565 RepID=UPI003743CA26